MLYISYLDVFYRTKTPINNSINLKSTSFYNSLVYAFALLPVFILLDHRSPKYTNLLNKSRCLPQLSAVLPNITCKHFDKH